MRKLGQALGVEAMALNNHVRNKDDLLDGIVDLVLDDIEVPPAGTHWRISMRHRSISAHEVLLAHPWAAMLIMSRFNIGPGMTRYLNETLGRLREGGFSITGALDAWHTLDSHLFGFTLHQLGLPFGAEEAPRCQRACSAGSRVVNTPTLRMSSSTSCDQAGWRISNSAST